MNLIALCNHVMIVYGPTENPSTKCFKVTFSFPKPIMYMNCKPQYFKKLHIILF